jgi:hypothetical protein
MMLPLRHLVASLVLLQAAGLSAAGTLEGDWVSYRDAYRAMVVFDKYGGAKNLLQHELQVLPKEAGTGAEPLQLALDGKTTHLKLALDATGRTVFPLLKAAYDENAVLALNRSHAQFALRPRVSINVRADGMYDVSELNAACEQALGYARYVDNSARGRHCVGVRFVFDKKAAGSVARLRKADGAAAVMPTVDGPAFMGDADAGFATVTYRFNGTEHAQVLTAAAPLAITPLFD